MVDPMLKNPKVWAVVGGAVLLIMLAHGHQAQQQAENSWWAPADAPCRASVEGMGFGRFTPRWTDTQPWSRLYAFGPEGARTKIRLFTHAIVFQGRDGVSTNTPMGCDFDPATGKVTDVFPDHSGR
jgi:hypothetical protein